jgi:glyoxylase-like metal-dependent hydrolase (beta-lactamase superfamily II)
MTNETDAELVDDDAGLILRRVVVGPLDTNCWIIAGTLDRRAVIVDPGDQPGRILDACVDLDVRAVILTHTHWDHVLALPDVADALGTPVLAHPHDQPVWPHECEHLRHHGHFDAGSATEQLLSNGVHLGPPNGKALWRGETTPVRHGTTVTVGDGLAFSILHTPGHTPGGISLIAGHHLFTGDTLFPGGPGLTGWPLSDFSAIIDSIGQTLFSLPDSTLVHPGHGRSTTIGTERPHLASWIQRGW